MSFTIKTRIASTQKRENQPSKSWSPMTNRERHSGSDFFFGFHSDLPSILFVYLMSFDGPIDLQLRVLLINSLGSEKEEGAVEVKLEICGNQGKNNIMIELFRLALRLSIYLFDCFVLPCILAPRPSVHVSMCVIFRLIRNETGRTLKNKHTQLYSGGDSGGWWRQKLIT